MHCDRSSCDSLYWRKRGKGKPFPFSFNKGCHSWIYHNAWRKKYVNLILNAGWRFFFVTMEKYVSCNNNTSKVFIAHFCSFFIDQWSFPLIFHTDLLWCIQLGNWRVGLQRFFLPPWNEKNVSFNNNMYLLYTFAVFSHWCVVMHSAEKLKGGVARVFLQPSWKEKFYLITTSICCTLLFILYTDVLWCLGTTGKAFIEGWGCKFCLPPPFTHGCVVMPLSNWKCIYWRTFSENCCISFDFDFPPWNK